MQKVIKYTTFKTKWGYFGFAAGNNGLLRTCLPLAEPERVDSRILQNFPNSRYDRRLFRMVQQKIVAYFEGACIDFLDTPVALSSVSYFCRLVLTASRSIGFGRTLSYSGLAKKIGRPAAARAVGGALAQNPLPLIIPCHRIICTDGKIGGFSALGGKDLKAEMLKHEQVALVDCKSC